MATVRVGKTAKAVVMARLKALFWRFFCERVVMVAMSYCVAKKTALISGTTLLPKDTPPRRIGRGFSDSVRSITIPMYVATGSTMRYFLYGTFVHGVWPAQACLVAGP